MDVAPQSPGFAASPIVGQRSLGFAPGLLQVATGEMHFAELNPQGRISLRETNRGAHLTDRVVLRAAMPENGRILRSGFFIFRLRRYRLAQAICLLYTSDAADE